MHYWMLYVLVNSIHASQINSSGNVPAQITSTRIFLFCAPTWGCWSWIVFHMAETQCFVPGAVLGSKVKNETFAGVSARNEVHIRLGLVLVSFCKVSPLGEDIWRGPTEEDTSCAGDIPEIPCPCSWSESEPDESENSMANGIQMLVFTNLGRLPYEHAPMLNATCHCVHNNKAHVATWKKTRTSWEAGRQATYSFIRK